jgi:lipopolysaccharide heptosyltransferase II
MIKNPSEIKRILIIKLRGIGDVILSTIVIQNLIEHFPNAKIDYLTEPPSVPILRTLNELDQIIPIERTGTISTVKSVIKLRNIQYDIVFDLYSNPRSALLTFFSKGKIKVGFDRRGRKYAYDVHVKTKDLNLHMAEVNLQQLKVIGIPVNHYKLKYKLTMEEEIFSIEFFNINLLEENVIAISPSGGWKSKRCEPSKFIEICRAVRSKYECKFLILWGEGDESDASEIYNGIKEFSVLAPRTSIREMVALFSKCKAVIANDSGPMHLSAAIGIPTFAIHGPTSPFEQGPYGSKHEWVRFDELDCIQCNLLDCPREHECMLQLDSDKVLARFEDLIKKNNIQFEKTNIQEFQFERK